ncbi:hypothetical protein [Polaromonas sp.]|uniref:hypothetical protein n=1 Tax=Polaromonas sp. TaxID=1869339 RepID=UPI003264C19E
MQDLERINFLIDRAAATLGSDNQLAAALGTSRQVVSNWRHGHKEPGADKQAQLAEMAGLDVGFHVTASAVEKTGHAAAIAWLAKRAEDWRKR